MATSLAHRALDEIRDLEAQHILQTYRRAPVAFVRGEGVHLFDTDGRRYVDLLSGIGVASLGHAHAGLAAALAEQAATLVHTSNLFFHPLQGAVAARLAGLSGLPRTFLCNSGTEAVEACLKFARRYWHTRGEPGRTRFVAFSHAFSGRTMGSLSVTWDEHYRTPFEPLVPGVTFVPAGDPAALDAAVTSDTAAIIAEPIQGEGGVRPLSPSMALAIEGACARTGALFIADEVQCGLGRTGAPFCFQTAGLTPDLVSVGKSLGSGMPVAAALVSADVAATIHFGDHGTTYGGNLLACRAALVFLDALTSGGLLDHVRLVGSAFESRLRSIAARHGFVKEIRGAGLMWGLDLGVDAAAIIPAALAHGVVVNRTAETVVRMLPPYVITEAEIDEGLGRLEAALVDVLGSRA
jgi:acetylornithine aminotransferase/acetylornithine/N-succinyldiaminopimelate aminotransferase